MPPSTLPEKVSADVLASEIARYDADDAALVAKKIRAIAGRDAVVDEIVSLYHEVIAQFDGMKHDSFAEERAAAGYLRSLSPRLKRIETERAKLSDRIAESERRAETLAKNLDSKQAELARMTNTLGWRLLSRYGPIKHRFVLPVYKRLQSMLPARTRSKS